MDVHVKVLGILNIVWGACGLLGALVVFTVLGGTAGLVAVSESSEDAVVAVPLLVGIGFAVATLILLLSLPSIIVGVGLVSFRPWGRILGVVLSILHLVSFPIGTILGAYGLWVLLNSPTVALFDPPSTRPLSV